MTQKEITVVFYRRNYPRKDWKATEIDETAVRNLLDRAKQEMAVYGITLNDVVAEDMVMDINSYGDILNAVRLQSPADGILNLCLGHVIGASPNCNLAEDLERGISRVAFAPETIQPEDHNRKVCHNCGCGC